MKENIHITQPQYNLERWRGTVSDLWKTLLENLKGRSKTIKEKAVSSLGWFGLLFLSYTVMRRCRFARGDKVVCFTPKIWIINSYQCILCSRAFLYIHPQLSASPFLLILYLIFMPCRLHFCLCCHVTHHIFVLLLLPVFVSSHCDCDSFRLCPLCVSLPPLYLSGLHFFADHYKSSLFVINLPHTTHLSELFLQTKGSFIGRPDRSSVFYAQSGTRQT